MSAFTMTGTQDQKEAKQDRETDPKVAQFIKRVANTTWKEDQELLINFMRDVMKNVSIESKCMTLFQDNGCRTFIHMMLRKLISNAIVQTGDMANLVENTNLTLDRMTDAHIRRWIAVPWKLPKQLFAMPVDLIIRETFLVVFRDTVLSHLPFMSSDDPLAKYEYHLLLHSVCQSTASVYFYVFVRACRPCEPWCGDMPSVTHA
jgi:hypothetical protein